MQVDGSIRMFRYHTLQPLHRRDDDDGDGNYNVDHHTLFHLHDDGGDAHVRRRHRRRDGGDSDVRARRHHRRDGGVPPLGLLRLWGGGLARSLSVRVSHDTGKCHFSESESCLIVSHSFRPCGL